jgi:hypothetical protein
LTEFFLRRTFLGRVRTLQGAAALGTHMVRIVDGKETVARS